MRYLVQTKLNPFSTEAIDQVNAILATARGAQPNTTNRFVAAYDSIADFPDRPDNIFAFANTLMGLATGHTAVAFTNASMVPPGNIRTTINSRGANDTTIMVPQKHLPLVMPLKYIGIPEDTLNKLDAILIPRVNAGYIRKVIRRRRRFRWTRGAASIRRRSPLRPTRRRSAVAPTRSRRFSAVPCPCCRTAQAKRQADH